MVKTALLVEGKGEKTRPGRPRTLLPITMAKQSAFNAHPSVSGDGKDMT